MKKTFSELQASSLNARRFILGASLLSLCVMTACSDSDDEQIATTPGSESNAPELQVVNLQAETSAAALAQRVTNLRSTTRATVATRATEIPADATVASELPAEVKANYKVTSSTVIPASVTVVSGGIYSEDVLDLTGKTVDIQGGVVTAKSIVASSITVSGGTLELGDGSYLSGNITASAGKVAVEGNVRVFGSVNLSDKATVTVNGGQTLNVGEKLNIEGENVVFDTDGSAQFAYVDLTLINNDKTKGTLNVTTSDLTNIFGRGYYVVMARTLSLSGNEEAVASSFALPSTLQLYTDDKAFDAWVADKSDVTLLEQVSVVKNSDSGDKAGLSATGIAVSGNDIYVSYHTQGTTTKGAVDIASLSGDEITLSKTLTTVDGSEYSFEFNHIALLDGKLYAVGNRAKESTSEESAKTESNGAGTIGVFDLTGNTISTRTLIGGDGNSIIKSGDFLQVATTYGYETYIASNLQRSSAISTDGHVKSIIKAGSNVVTLEYASETATDSKEFTKKVDGEEVALQEIPLATKKFAATDYMLEKAETVNLGFAVSTIVPIAGKNVLAYDAATSTYYAALGANGVATSKGDKFQVARKTDTKVPAGYANCVAVDDDYLYVAYGSAGVYVLDKSTLAEVASYTNAGGKSANYVAVANGKIYVAYGQDGWQVLQLATVAK